ncbi:MAG: hypothetical protein H6735_06525 [Alphaproteobacteria bacterium]|nr:hypothetical protein [Alphaproteobacteria bacterium]
MLIVGAALAAEPAHPDDEVAARTEASARYGKEIPWAAMCFARPTPWEGLAPLVVGVSKAATGCEPYGVVLDGAWTEPTSVPGWADTPADQREAHATAWVDQVLLAFAQPTGQPTVATARDGAVTVARELLRRDGRDRRTAEAVHTVVIGVDGIATTTEEVRRSWETTFALQHLSTEGLGGQGAVHQALEQVGGGLGQCIAEGWRADHAFRGATRLQWTVAAGAVTQVAVVQIGEGDVPALPEPVVRCIGNAIRRVRWGDDAAGTTMWVFLVDRR